MPINDLRAMGTFARAIGLGSLRKAAAVQGMSAQAASQALAQLEQRLGVRLPHRTTRSLSLTDEGQRLLEATQPALAMLERADVRFRIGAPPEEGLIARKLFPVQLLVCASPAYLERHGEPRCLDDLARHRCSVFRHPATGQVFPWFLKVDGEVVRRDLPPALSTNDVEMELRAVLDAQVIAQLSAVSAAPRIRAGRVRPVLIQHMTDNMVCYGSRRAQPARVRRFIDFAVERLTDNADFVLSKRELGTTA